MNYRNGVDLGEPTEEPGLTGVAVSNVAVDYRTMIDSQRDDVPGHIDYDNALRVIAGFTLHWGGR